MTTFAELCESVYEETLRPDLVDKTKRAVSTSTLVAHRSYFFTKDLTAQSIQFPETSYIQQLNVDEKLAGFRKCNAIYVNEDIVLNEIDIMHLKDSYDEFRTDVWYAAGAYFNIRCSVKFNECFISYYKNPEVSETYYDSWIAKENPRIIVASAAASLCRSLGWKDRANDLELESRTMLSQLYADEVAR